MRDELKEQMNLIDFEGLSGIRIGDAMHYLPEYNPKYRLIKSLIKMISACCIDRTICKKYGNAKIIFLFTNAYSERKDFRVPFHNVINLIEEKIVLFPCRKVNLKNILRLKLFFQWLRQMNKLDITLKEKYFLLSHLIVCVDELFAVKKVLRHNPEIRLLTCLCDAHCQDSIVVQFCNQRGIDTASLQHGDLSAKFNSWAIEGSKSKFYLVYGQYVKDQMKKMNVSENKPICVGMPQYINHRFPAHIKTDKTNKFGVILSGGWMLESDKKLLMCADIFSRQYGLKYCVKMHPCTNKAVYGELLDSERIDGCYLTEVNIIEFGEMIDFAIATNSTVFYEYTLHMIPIFLYEHETIYNMFYEEIKWCRFKTAEELNVLYDMTKNRLEELTQYLYETRSYLCEMEDIANKYRDFFQKYLI